MEHPDMTNELTSGWPLVSVVVPVFNAERYIVECLQSILDQDYPALQVIVVDDGSTDGTAALVQQRFGNRITYRRQPNSGSAVARNLGVELAEGAFIAFNDSDDLWAPHRLRQQVRFLQGQDRYHAVCGRFEKVGPEFTLADANARRYTEEVTVDEGWSGWAYLKLLESSIYHVDCLLVRSEVMKKIRFNPDYRRGQDFDFFLQLSHATPIAQLDNLYAFYRQNPQGITHKPHLRNYRAEILAAALQRWGRRDQDGREITQQRLDQLLATSWFGHGYELVRARWFKHAARSFKLALKHDPMRLSSWKYLLISWAGLLRDQSPVAHAGAK
jgi:glycosyltransferase involved in cell wall biosynthesis